MSITFESQAIFQVKTQAKNVPIELGPRPRAPSTSSDTEDESSFYQMLDSEKISAKKAEQLLLERESALAGSSQASAIEGPAHMTRASFLDLFEPLPLLSQQTENG